MSRWREQKLRADNTSVIVIFFEEGGTKTCQPKEHQPAEQASTESQTDTDTASEVSSETPREQTPLVTEPNKLDLERPPLVRSLAFRCTDTMQTCLQLPPPITTEESQPSIE